MTDYICRICSLRLTERELAPHVSRCVKRNEDFIDACRPVGHPFEGDPELSLFAREEGSVYNRRPGTRLRPH